jgi:hypothetical protein
MKRLAEAICGRPRFFFNVDQIIADTDTSIEPGFSFSVASILNFLIMVIMQAGIIKMFRLSNHSYGDPG